MKKLFAILLAFGLALSLTACVEPANLATPGSITDGNITDGNITDGNATDGDVMVATIDTDYFSFVVENAEKNFDENVWGVRVAIENKSDEFLTFSCGEILINGILVENEWMTEIANNCAEYGFITFDLDALADLGIDTVESLDFTLNVVDFEGNTLEDVKYVFILEINADAVSSGDAGALDPTFEDNTDIIDAKG